MATHITKNKKLLSVSINDKILEEFKELAGKKCINKSMLVESLLKSWIEDNE